MQEVIQEVKECVGLDLEGTYTGKALAALKADAKAGLLKDQDVCYLHTWHSKKGRNDLGNGSNLPSFLKEYKI